jgi:hypothetical protein
MISVGIPARPLFSNGYEIKPKMKDIDKEVGEIVSCSG